MDREDMFLMWFAVLLMLLCVSMGFYTYTTNVRPKAASNYIMHENYNESRGLDIKTESQDYLK